MQRPLAGIRVLDMALMLPGALAATWLGDLGAAVVRVEPAWNGGILGWHQQGPDPYFAPLRSNKEIRRLNLRRPADREQLFDLIDRADILIEGFRPGTLDARGLGYEAMRARNPGLIYCSVTAFGQEGPLREASGHDANFLALAGILGANRAEGGPPHLLPIQLADVGGGTYPALVAILTALFVRERTGQGQHLDVALFDGSVAWNYYNFPLHRVPEMNEAGLGLGLLTGDALCYNVYECADGAYLALGALDPHLWRNVCDLLGRPDLLPLAANPPPGSTERMAAFRALFRSRPRAEWLALLEQKETLVSPILTLDEVLQSEMVQRRGLVEQSGGLPRARFPVAVAGGTASTAPERSNGHVAPPHV